MGEDNCDCKDKRLADARELNQWPFVRKSMRAIKALFVCHH